MSRHAWHNIKLDRDQWRRIDAPGCSWREATNDGEEKKLQKITWYFLIEFPIFVSAEKMKKWINKNRIKTKKSTEKAVVLCSGVEHSTKGQLV